MLRSCLLAVMVACAGCGLEQSEPEVEPTAVTVEELNLALAYLAKTDEGMPDTVQQLLELPQFRGMVLPETPPGIILVIDREHKKVIPYLDETSIQQSESVGN